MTHEKQERVTCLDCLGRGRKKDGSGGTFACPRCGGKGSEPPEKQERIQGPVSIEAARCPICRHPAKADDYTERGTHLCTRDSCVCPTGKDTTRKQRAAVRLRVAALAFARLPVVKDANDIAGRRANRKLLNAAVAYAEAGPDDDPIHPASISHGHGTFIFCVPHRCGTPSPPDEQMRLGAVVDAALRKAGRLP